MVRRRHQTHADEIRRHIATEAARLIAESGLRDYHEAKRKAALRLGVFDEATLPRNLEVEDALREHQRLFQADTQPRALRRLREAAVEAMRFLARFQPRLVGAVLEGTADAHSAVRLHLFADDVRDVLALLDDHGIPYEEDTHLLATAVGHEVEVPSLRLSADGVAVELMLFACDGLHHAPLDRVTRKPMRRASLTAVEALVAAD
ncbi:MAG TPA: hypothetical protein PKO41_08325 [Dokdonella sp.]|uniref:hypothetical protein n=1 Tax=Dokdonella sp. TaxID=2291710 RepID=UPI0025C59B4A|nr:hypothetical protein [Dokdonella sp.]MBX3690736.1 hypothetical protein [Dokdonella sp.]MCW5566879.1 hypothetical protein [Dokdonella sp.]HNR92416.1 hypothetical protein [Dokdonella sp.]